MADEIYDLQKFAEHLGDSHPKLRGTIIKLRDFHSVRADLAVATAFIDDAQTQALRLGRSERKMPQHNIASLTWMAIILYARAVKSRSAHRRTLDIRSKLSSTEKEIHAKLCDLRDDAVAHYGPGGTYKGAPWQNEAVAVVMEEDGGKVCVVTRQTLVNPSLIAKVKGQLKTALEIAISENETLIESLTDELNKCIKNDEIRSKFLACETKQEAIFSGAERLALIGPRVGSRTLYGRSGP